MLTFRFFYIPNERGGLRLSALFAAGMFLDAVTIFLVLLPLVKAYDWDLVWFGVLMTMNLAIGQFTPPMAVNLMVTCTVANVRMERTVQWVLWMVGAMLLALIAVAAIPDIALWLPRRLGY